MGRRHDDDYDGDDDDPSAVPRTQDSDERHTKTARRRAISKTDAEEIARASAREQAREQARQQQSMNRADQLRALELQFAEWFGADGDGGKLATMEADITGLKTSRDQHAGQLATLSEFKGRIMWLGGLAVTIGGAIAALAFKLIDHVLK